MFGKIKNSVLKGQSVIIDFENGQGSLSVITSKIIRVFSGNPEIKSKAIEGDKALKTSVKIKSFENGVEIITENIKAIVKDDFKVDFFDANGRVLCRDYQDERTLRTKFSEKETREMSDEDFINETKAKRHKISVVKKMDGDECFYGLGDKAGSLNKRHYEYEMWNTDQFLTHTETIKELYKSIPFFITLKKDCCYGIFFDNTNRTFFDMGKESDEYYYFGADDGNLDYYFIAGEKMPEVLQGYTHLTGTTPLPQMWTLGYHQSRWSYKSEDEVKELVKKFRNEHIPLDAIHLDIDYMEQFEDFTFDKKRFPNPKKMTEEIAKDGVKIVTIMDAGVKKLDGYDVYDEGKKNGYFVNDKDGNEYVNWVWPGEAVFPDMGRKEVRKWWSENQKKMVESGVRGIWNDMNEPASFHGEIPGDVVFHDEERTTTHSEMHNTFGSFMSKATYEGLLEYGKKRPFVITRACYAGVQKYSTVWTGDNRSIWDHLRMAIPQLCNLSLSGIFFAGTDIGGFNDDTNPELLARWVEVGCLSPLFRNHSALDTIRQEPWVFGKEIEDIYRTYVRLRYKLIPYFYDLFFMGEKTGLPVLKPLVFNYSDDIKTHNLNSEFMIGDSLIAAPVVEQGATEKLVYLPKGKFYDFFTGVEVEGGKSFIKEAPLDTLPLYVREGAIIPLFPEQEYIGEKKIDTLELNVYPGIGSYTHFQDDGETLDYRFGLYNEYLCKIDGNKFSIDLVHEGYGETYKQYKINFMGKSYTFPFTKGKLEVTL